MKRISRIFTSITAIEESTLNTSYIEEDTTVNVKEFFSPPPSEISDAIIERHLSDKSTSSTSSLLSYRRPRQRHSLNDLSSSKPTHPVSHHRNTSVDLLSFTSRSRSRSRRRRCNTIDEDPGEKTSFINTSRPYYILQDNLPPSIPLRSTSSHTSLSSTCTIKPHPPQQPTTFTTTTSDIPTPPLPPRFYATASLISTLPPCPSELASLFPEDEVSQLKARLAHTLRQLDITDTLLQSTERAKEDAVREAIRNMREEMQDRQREGNMMLVRLDGVVREQEVRIRALEREVLMLRGGGGG